MILSRIRNGARIAPARAERPLPREAAPPEPALVLHVLGILQVLHVLFCCGKALQLFYVLGITVEHTDRVFDGFGSAFACVNRFKTSYNSNIVNFGHVLAKCCFHTLEYTHDLQELQEVFSCVFSFFRKPMKQALCAHHTRPPRARLAPSGTAPKTRGMGKNNNVDAALAGSDGLVRAAGRVGAANVGAAALALALGRVAGNFGLPLEELLQMARGAREAVLVQAMHDAVFPRGKPN